eukprot:6851289-Heterocapsa_arctica.AAC.1
MFPSFARGRAIIGTDANIELGGLPDSELVRPRVSGVYPNARSLVFMGFMIANDLLVTIFVSRPLAAGAEESSGSDEQIHTHVQDNGGRKSQRDFILYTAGPAIWTSVDPNVLSDHAR